MSPKILIIEDEPSIIANLRYALETEGFSVSSASTAESGKALLEKESFDCIILDVGLPDQSGFDLCKEIRKQLQTPVLFLTARSEEIDRVVGLEIGADDYVIKPFSPRELTARVRAILRRTSPNKKSDPKKVNSKAFEIREEQKRILYFGQPLVLTRYEYRLLQILLEKPGWVFSRDQLMERVWDDPGSSLDRTVDAHIKSLRSKLKNIRPKEDPIQTHRGMGYSLKENL